MGSISASWIGGLGLWVLFLRVPDVDDKKIQFFSHKLFWTYDSLWQQSFTFFMSHSNSMNFPVPAKDRVDSYGAEIKLIVVAVVEKNTKKIRMIIKHHPILVISIQDEIQASRIHGHVGAYISKWSVKINLVSINRTLNLHNFHTCSINQHPKWR